MGIMLLSGATQGYTDYSNQAAALYNVHYKWTDMKEIVYNQELIGASVILGCCLGAASGGKLMQYGRRRAHLIALFAGMFGVVFTLIKDFEMQLFGRLVYGYAAGLQSVVSPRFIEEYVPNDYVGTCITIFTFAQNLGLLIAMFIAVILPEDWDIESLEANESWRIIFGLPIISYLMILIGLVFLIPYDAPKYHISQGERYKALKSIHKIYKTDNSERTAQRIYNYIKRSST